MHDATALLALRQPTPTVMSLTGWSDESMASRYQHVTDAMRSEVAGQVGELIWQPPPAGSEDPQTVRVRPESLATVLDFATEHTDSEGAIAAAAGPAPRQTSYRAHVPGKYRARRATRH